MATLVERAIGAARLDVVTYEEIERDPTALSQALLVVVLAAVASGIGSASVSGEMGPGLIGGAIVGLVGWFVWAFTIFVVGTRMLPEPETRSDLGEMLRTTGFASAPGIAGILGIVPGIGGLILFAVWLWQLAAMVIAVRQALDYTSTGRAIAVCVIGVIVQMLVIFVIVAALVAMSVAIFGAGTSPATIP